MLRRREALGLAFMTLGSLAGWPAAALLVAASLRWSEPLLAAVVAPFLVFAGHALFAAGLYLAGGRGIAALARSVKNRRRAVPSAGAEVGAGRSGRQGDPTRPGRC